MCQKIRAEVSPSLPIPKLTQYIQFVKSGQKIWAGPPPSFGQNPKEQLLFFGRPSLSWGKMRTLFAWGVWLAFSTLTYETWGLIDGYGICFTVAQGSVTLLASGGYGIDYIMLNKFRISRPSKTCWNSVASHSLPLQWQWLWGWCIDSNYWQCVPPWPSLLPCSLALMLKCFGHACAFHGGKRRFR